MPIHQDEINAALHSGLEAYMSDVIKSIELSHCQALSNNDTDSIAAAMKSMISRFEWSNSTPMIDVNEIDFSDFKKVDESEFKAFIGKHGKNGQVPLLCHEIGDAFVEFGSYKVIAFSEVICVGHEQFFILKG